MSGFLKKHDTDMGSIWSHWTSRGLYSVQLEEPSIDGFLGAEHLGVQVQTQIEQLDQMLCEYTRLGTAKFDQIKIDPSGWTDFSQCVYEQCRQIPPGETVTYKELATRCGNAAASRAVGAAMARNRVLLVIPCHRVVASNGQLRGFSAPGGLETKQRLLDLERQPNPETATVVQNAQTRLAFA